VDSFFQVIRKTNATEVLELQEILQLNMDQMYKPLKMSSILLSNHLKNVIYLQLAINIVRN